MIRPGGFPEGFYSWRVEGTAEHKRLRPPPVLSGVCHLFLLIVLLGNDLHLGDSVHQRLLFLCGELFL